MRAVTAIVITLTTVSTSFAQVNYCGKADDAITQTMGDSIFGEWTMTPLGGYAMIGGEYFPYPAMAPLATSIFPGEGGRIYALNAEMTDKVELVAADEPRWQFDADGLPADQAPPLTVDEIGIAAGCDAHDLPRLVARTQLLLDDSAFDMVMRLFVINDVAMYGMIESSGTVVGDDFYAVRAISLTK